MHLNAYGYKIRHNSLVFVTFKINFNPEVFVNLSSIIDIMMICSYISSIHTNYFLLQERIVLSRLSDEFFCSMKFSWWILQGSSKLPRQYLRKHLPTKDDSTLQRKLYMPFPCDPKSGWESVIRGSSMLTSITVLDSIPYPNYPITQSTSWNHLENKLIALNFVYQCLF